jgi:hypothetical protein
MKKIRWGGDPIELVQLDGTEIPKGGDQPMPWRKFLLQRLNDQRFGIDYKTIMVAVKLRDAINALEDGADLVLEDTDWEMLREATYKPSAGYIPGYYHCLTPFMDAVLEAK